MTNPSWQRGEAAEQRAADYLQQQGLKFIQKNYRCKLGEIDLIMRDQNHLVFIEVRMRQQESLSDSLESITRSKQRHIIRTAKHYLYRHQLTDRFDCRFDVVGFDGNKLQWIKNAFY